MTTDGPVFLLTFPLLTGVRVHRPDCRRTRRCRWIAAITLDNIPAGARPCRHCQPDLTRDKP